MVCKNNGSANASNDNFIILHKIIKYLDDTPIVMIKWCNL